MNEYRETIMIEVQKVSEKQTMEIYLTLDGVAQKIVIKFDRDNVKDAELSVDGQHWVGVMVARTAIQAFVEKYAIDLE